MTISREAMDRLAQHWAVEAFGADERSRASELSKVRMLRSAIGNHLALGAWEEGDEVSLLGRLAVAYELAAIEGLDALLYPAGQENAALRELAQAGAHAAFEIKRSLPIPEMPEERIFHVLHVASLAYSGDRWADLRRWLKERPEAAAVPPVADTPWDLRVLFRLFECWIRLLRKDGWDDLNAVAPLVVALREEQRQYEPPLLAAHTGAAARAMAYRLVALYHWAKATELLAVYMLQGEPRSIDTQLDQHFEAAQEGARNAMDPMLDVLVRWLHAAARRMVAGSVWWVAHTVNARVTSFVQSVTRARALFELLPPQRAALREQGLLDVANRAIVVDLPTSGGKTVLAQFRILQALNQHAENEGWVAYVAPTRALVSQITRRLRADFSPLRINVEQLTAAVEVDSFEETLLATQTAESSFHVLVTTPEKLHLVIRNKKISRPLALVVMDEAHNIEDEERGLRIELLLATIKRDCADSNFLLLTPFIPKASAEALATWLSPDGGKSISLGTTAWQPNERIVGIYRATEEAAPPRGWALEFETLTTSRGTIHLRGRHRVGENRPLDLPPSRVRNSLSLLTGAMANVFGASGRTSIAVARRIIDAWSMARAIADSSPEIDITPDIALVQRFLATEISPEFELIGMLGKGVGVHHAGLSDETRSLIEWLAESGQIRVLCATTTIAQGINFPVSSVFLASRMLPVRASKEMSPRAFWNLAGRAGRMDQDSVGVVGIAAGDRPEEIRQYVSRATGELISRLAVLLDGIERAGALANLSVYLQQDQWADFRSYIAHLYAEKKNLDAVLAETEQLLRNTFGYRSLQAQPDDRSRAKARALLEATRRYAEKIAEQPQSATLADATGFAPEGVNSALFGLRNLQLERKLSLADWQPKSLFGAGSVLPQLVGVMMRVPEIRHQLEDFSSGGNAQRHIAQVAQAWISGQSIESIAKQFFTDAKKGTPLTDAITEACRGIYRTLATAGAWGLSALTKLPTSGIDIERLTEEERRIINSLPAMLYHGVQTEAGVLMRMNTVPRSVAESIGAMFVARIGDEEARRNPRVAREFVRDLPDGDWERAAPKGATMTGADYRAVWERLSGESG